MTSPLFILVGPNPNNAAGKSPGGQLSMSIGLKEYAISQGYDFKIIDTLQENFPVPPFSNRLKRGTLRIYQLIRVLHTRQITGVIILSACGASFYERILMAGLCRLYRVKSIFFMLSGAFVTDIERSLIVRSSAKIFLQLPTFIGIQGEGWRCFYRNLGVENARIVTIRNWLPFGFVTAKNPIIVKSNEIIRFCFVGWLIEEKGVNALSEAIILLATDYRFEFVFVGGGTLQTELNEKIQKYNLCDRVKMAGWVDSDAVHKYLIKAHVYVLPSKAEGFPMALLEAISLGLPSICTNVGAISDSLINGKSGYLLSDGDSSTIANAMKNYLIDRELIHLHSIEALKIFDKQHDRVDNCKRLFSLFLP